MLLRSSPSRSPSSWIWRANSSISLSMSRASMPSALIRLRSEDWCSTCRGRLSGSLSPELGCRDSLLLLFLLASSACASLGWTALLCALLLLPSPAGLARLASLLLLPAALAAASVASRRLISCTCSSSLLSSSSSLTCSSVRSWNFNLLRSFSPLLYIASISSLSACVFPFPGLSDRYMSNRVVTLASCLVSLTASRQLGQVYIGLFGGGGGPGAVSARMAWEENHSFKHAPQKVCRQSRRVRGL